MSNEELTVLAALAALQRIQQEHGKGSEQYQRALAEYGAAQKKMQDSRPDIFAR